jgi:sugar/nucleoside kinase (ribokinase family)
LSTVKELVSTYLGSAGAALLWDGRISFAQPVSVAPLDTTGAGDSFDAGFLQAWLTGCAPELCLQRANLCGALSTEAYGGIAGFPSLERLQREATRNHHA